MDLVDQVSTASDDAADQIGMTAEIFRSRVHDQVNAEFRRTCVDGSSKSAVYQRDQVVFAGDGSDGFQSDYPQHGVGGRFDVKQPGVGTNGAGMLIVIVGVNERSLDPELGQPLGEELGDAAINIALSDDVITALEQGENRSRDRVHARGKKQSRVDALELCDRIFRNRVSGIAVARVEHVRVRGPHLLLGVSNFEGRGLVDGCGERPVLPGEIGTSADSLGFAMVLMWLHADLHPNYAFTVAVKAGTYDSHSAER